MLMAYIFHPPEARVAMWLNSSQWEKQDCCVAHLNRFTKRIWFCWEVNAFLLNRQLPASCRCDSWHKAVSRHGWIGRWDPFSCWEWLEKLDKIYLPKSVWEYQGNHKAMENHWANFWEKRETQWGGPGFSDQFSPEDVAWEVRPGQNFNKCRERWAVKDGRLW